MSDIEDPERAPQRRVRIQVTGRVQGVGFRAFVAAHARRLGVSGWVRNLSSGAVELEAQGERSQVEALLRSAAVREGPPPAAVEQVCVDDRALGPEDGRFRILPDGP